MSWHELQQEGEEKKSVRFPPAVWGFPRHASLGSLSDPPWARYGTRFGNTRVHYVQKWWSSTKLPTFWFWWNGSVFVCSADDPSKTALTPSNNLKLSSHAAIRRSLRSLSKTRRRHDERTEASRRPDGGVFGAFSWDNLCLALSWSLAATCMFNSRERERKTWRHAATPSVPRHPELILSPLIPSLHPYCSVYLKARCVYPLSGARVCLHAPFFL